MSPLSGQGCPSRLLDKGPSKFTPKPYSGEDVSGSQASNLHIFFVAVCTEFSVLETHRARKLTRGSSTPGGEG